MHYSSVEFDKTKTYIHISLYVYTCICCIVSETNLFNDIKMIYKYLSKFLFLSRLISGAQEIIKYKTFCLICFFFPEKVINLRNIAALPWRSNISAACTFNTSNQFEIKHMKEYASDLSRILVTDLS